MGKFKKGIVIGGLLGAGLTWLNFTKKGKETRDKLLDYAAEVYSEVKARVLSSSQWEQLTRQKYVAMVREAVDKYAVNNPMAQKAKEMVVKVVAAQWQRLRQELESGKKK